MQFSRPGAWLALLYGATLALGIIRGLLQDANATGESDRIDAAFAAFDRLAQPPRTEPRID